MCYSKIDSTGNKSFRYAATYAMNVMQLIKKKFFRQQKPYVVNSIRWFSIDYCLYII